MLTAKEVAKLSDDQVLELAKGMGPAIIGPHLFERAKKVQSVNPTGSFGPAIIGVDATKLEEKVDDELEDYEDPDVDGFAGEETEDEQEAREAREEEDLARMRADERALDRELEKELRAEESGEPAPAKPKAKAKARSR